MAKFTSLLRHNGVISSFGHMMPYSEVFFNGYFICSILTNGQTDEL